MPVSDELMDVNVSDSCVKLHPPGTNPHFSSSAQLQKDEGKLHGEKKKHLESQGFTMGRRIFQTALKGHVSALLIHS